MTLSDLSRFYGQQPLTAEWLNNAADMIETGLRITVSPPLEIRRHSRGINISMQQTSLDMLFAEVVSILYLGQDNFVGALSANPYDRVNETIDTNTLLILKGTGQVDATPPDYPGDPLHEPPIPGESLLRVGLYDISPGDIIGYLPFNDLTEIEPVSGLPYNGQVLAHAGARGSEDTGPILAARWPTIPGICLHSDDFSIDVDKGDGEGGLGKDFNIRLILTSLDGSVTIAQPADQCDTGYDLAAHAGCPGDTVESETTWGIPPSAGVGTYYSRVDHTHGSPDEPQMGITYKAGDGIVIDEDNYICARLQCAYDSSLGFDYGEITHELQAPMIGVGMPTGISGENLGWVEIEGESAVFDINGHYNPDITNTLIHTGPGCPVYCFCWGECIAYFDATGHLVFVE